jgi:hypothetical protein
MAGEKYKQINSYAPRNASLFGAPAERVAASQQGFNVGYRDNRDIQFALREGASYVSNR